MKIWAEVCQSSHAVCLTDHNKAKNNWDGGIIVGYWCHLWRHFVIKCCNWVKISISCNIFVDRGWHIMVSRPQKWGVLVVQHGVTPNVWIWPNLGKCPPDRSRLQHSFRLAKVRMREGGPSKPESKYKDYKETKTSVLFVEDWLLLLCGKLVSPSAIHIHPPHLYLHWRVGALLAASASTENTFISDFFSILIEHAAICSHIAAHSLWSCNPP